MKTVIKILALFSLLFLFWNCGPVYPGNGDDNAYPVPELRDPGTGYHPGKEVLHCEIKALYDLEIEEVQADIYLQGFEAEHLSLTLNDSGSAGDAIPYDHIFSRNTPLERIDSLDGRIAVRYTVDAAGSLAQSYDDTLRVEANQPPEITQIVMPDTLVRPRTGTKDLYIYVYADDPNGVHDVTDAFFQVQDVDDASWSADYNLYDNGESGDERAGDGIFSTGLVISADNQPVTNYFRFRVKDTASNFSEWTLDSVVVR